MTTKTTKLPVNRANGEIASTLRNHYFPTLGEGIDAIKAILAKHGFTTDCFEGIYCGNGSFIGPVGGGRFVSFSWYRMEVTGNYEVVSYIS